MKISFIIPTLNRHALLNACIYSIRKSAGKLNATVELIVINQGDDIHLDNVILIETKDKGLSKARNLGISRCTGDYLVFMDDDAEIAEDFVEKLVKLVKDIPAGAFCGRLYDPHKKEYFSDFFLNSSSKFLGYFDYRHFKGSAHVLKRDMFKKTGLYDENFGAGARFAGAEESDIFFRLKQKHEQVYYSADLVFHHPKQLTPGKVFDYSRSVSAMLTKQILSDLPRAGIYCVLIAEILLKNSIRSLQNIIFPRQTKLINDLFQFSGVVKGSLAGISAYLKYRTEN